MPETRASLVAQLVKNLPAMQETWVQSLGWEDPLEKQMATTPVLLPGKSHGQRSLEGYSPWDHKQSEMTVQLNFTFTFIDTANPLRMTCPRWNQTTEP